jgi:precorrin-6x reductase
LAEIVLFGGTSEARILISHLQQKGISALVCVATEYGETILTAGGSVSVRTGRLDEAAMRLLLAEQSPRLVIDATHPYADIVSRNLRAACQSAQTPYLRIKRAQIAQDGVLTFSDMPSLIDWLNTMDGVIFSGLGAKEARALTAVRGFEKRVWLRILPFAEGLHACVAMGYPPAHMICMQGPFSRELNAAMFRAANAQILVTKESGSAGGFLEKIAAAQDCGMTTAVLARPVDEEGVSLKEAIKQIEGGT